MSDIDTIHHVGLIVRDMQAALATYRRLGFHLAPPAYPMLPREDGPPIPFGAANTHADLERNFVELATCVDADSPVPADAQRVPLKFPPEVRPRVTAAITHAIETMRLRLSRYEGLHRIVFHARDVQAVAERWSSLGIGHSGVNVTQREVPSPTEPRMEVIRTIELSGDDPGAAQQTPEAMVAVAQNLPTPGERSGQHPNGAIGVVDCLLCAAADQLDDIQARYETILGRPARCEALTRVFPLGSGRLSLVAAPHLDSVLPGEQPPALPSLVAFAVAVRDLAATQTWLHAQDFPVVACPAGGVFVPGSAAPGVAIVFRQAAGV